MPEFRYIAVDDSGNRTRGAVDAESEREARRAILSQGVTPVSLTSGLADAALPEKSNTLRVSVQEQMLFCRLVGALLEAGLDLTTALESASRQARPKVRPLYERVRTAIANGDDLSTAVASVLGSNSSISTAALAAGERTGSIVQVLLSIAEQLDSQLAIRARVQGALLYPMVLAGVSVVIATGLVAFVVPEVARVFDGIQQDLPWLTQLLLSFSAFLETNGIAVLVVAMVAAVSVRAWSNSASGSPRTSSTLPCP